MVASVLSPMTTESITSTNWVVSVVNVSGNAVLVVEGANLTKEGTLFNLVPFAWSVEILNDDGIIYPQRRVDLALTRLREYQEYKRQSWNADPRRIIEMSEAIEAEQKEAMVPEAKGHRVPYQSLGADHPLAGLFGPGHNSASWCNEKLKIAIPHIGTAITASKSKKIGCVIS